MNDILRVVHILQNEFPRIPFRTLLDVVYNVEKMGFEGFGAFVTSYRILSHGN